MGKLLTDKNEFRKNLIVITIVYIVAHGFLLIVSGRWWDDWCGWQNMDAVKQVSMEIGRPSVYWIHSFTSFLPEAGYRWMTFFFFYAISLCFYGILKNALHLSDKMLLPICLLFTVLPINDARIMMAVFPYTVGYFLFMVGFYLLTVYIEREFSQRKRIAVRLLVLFLFFFSYTLNSCLVLYAVPLLYLLVSLRSFKKTLRHIDFFMLPILYFVLKNTLFPANGVYQGYNAVTLKGLLYAVSHIIQADIRLCLSLAKVLMPYLILSALTVICLAVFVHVREIGNMAFMGIRRFNEAQYNGIEISECVIPIERLLMLLAVGILFLSAGLFPYVAIRGTYIFGLLGVGGRDAMLAALGASIILYVVVEFTFHKRIVGYVYAIIILAGILCINSQYLGYQKDYYRQMGFQYQLEQHEELRPCQNIVYLSVDGFEDTTRFYTLNGNAEQAYGDQTRFVMNGFSNASYLGNGGVSEFSIRPQYRMMEYDVSHTSIDAVIEYSNPIGKKDALRLKMYELLNRKKFDEEIYQCSDLKVMLKGSDEYRKKLKEAGIK